MDIKIEAKRNGKSVFVKPEELTIDELVEALSWIDLDGDELVSDEEIAQGYAAINEACRRLESTETDCGKADA